MIQKINPLTKIVCTLGIRPQSCSLDKIVALMDVGMTIARLNFSHGTHDSHFSYLETIRKAKIIRPHNSLGVMLDTKGPQIRTGNNKNGANMSIAQGQLIRITTDYTVLGEEGTISCSYESIVNVPIGQRVLFADGKITGEVVSKQLKAVVIRALNGGQLGEKKNMCLPGCPISLPTVTNQDVIDIVNFGVKNCVDFIALSFTRRKEDILAVRELVKGTDIKIICKIENHEGVANIEEIVAESDGIMIARGDLGMEVPLEQLTLIQKKLTSATVSAGKPVILATQILDSMERQPRPTRAQVSDLSNAVFDMVDATMTSGETANGLYPIQACSFMSRCLSTVEKAFDYQFAFQNRVRDKSLLNSYFMRPQTVESILNKDTKCLNLVRESFESERAEIEVLVDKKESFSQVRIISSLRPKARIICLCPPYLLDWARVESSVLFGVFCVPLSMNAPSTINLGKL